MMKQKYTRFELQVVGLENEDVITTSVELTFSEYDNWFNSPEDIWGDTIN